MFYKNNAHIVLRWLSSLPFVIVLPPGAGRRATIRPSMVHAEYFFVLSGRHDFRVGMTY